MIRIALVTCDWGAAVAVGAPTETTLKTFDVDIPELERLMKSYAQDKSIEEAKGKWVCYSRQVVGVEVL